MPHTQRSQEFETSGRYPLCLPEHSQHLLLFYLSIKHLSPAPKHLQPVIHTHSTPILPHILPVVGSPLLPVHRVQQVNKLIDLHPEVVLAQELSQLGSQLRHVTKQQGGDRFQRVFLEAVVSA